MFEFTNTANTGGKNAGAGNKRARTGIFTTPHGDLLTPVFAPVGTQAVSPCLPVCKKAKNNIISYPIFKSDVNIALVFICYLCNKYKE